MPEGRTSTYNPATGERQETTFQYTSPERLQGIEAMDTRAVNDYLRQIEKAEVALDAALKFQGLRALEKSVREAQKLEAAQRDAAVADAYRLHGPGAFASRPQAVGPTIRAVTPKPPPIVPQITPYQRESLDLQKKRLDRPPTVSETVKQVPNPAFFPGMTNVPPMISTTNRTTRGIPSTASSQAPAKLSEQVAESPFKEGQKVRNKKTGQLFEIRNGVPVEIKE